MITTTQLRTKWLDFWKSKDHTVIGSASILPDNDPTALFHNSGMHPLVPYLSGETHPQGIRLCNAQKCIRTGDIDEVGDATHLTFFEMLGNWSLGDFFKEEQIPWSFEFLTEVLELPLEKLAFSVFAGDANAPRDEEAAELWMAQGVPKDKIAYLGAEDNWWAKGDTGPCGPDTEMFFWTGDEPAPANFQATHSDPRWVEIWNDVFMQFEKKSDGSLVPLTQQNIDTGMGLERTVAVLNGKTSVFQTDAFANILQTIADISGHAIIADNPISDDPICQSARVIADHLRAATVMLGDGIVPSNVDQGYILRRLIRRAVRHGRKIGITENFCTDIAKVVIENLGEAYPELQRNEEVITSELLREEEQFQKTLEKGLKEFHKMVDQIPSGEISGTIAFYIYETYGFPLEMTIELAEEIGKKVDISGFHAAHKAHQEKSRAGSEQKFSGGLADHSEMTTKLHTATHLLHAGLRKVLGEHVQQKGSNITPERLRFDFSHDEKLTEDELSAVENYVNEAIQSGQDVSCHEMTVEEAKESGALGFFEHKYGDRVKVYDMGPHSMEICGGPHVENLKTLGHFKIKKQESCGRGVRRIKAVLSSE